MNGGKAEVSPLEGQDSLGNRLGVMWGRGARVVGCGAGGCKGGRLTFSMGLRLT